jgi:hypothetical protein
VKLVLTTEVALTETTADNHRALRSVAQMTPPDRTAAEPYLGRYSHDASVSFSDGRLQLH